MTFSLTFSLGDDGTMDTIIVCNDCKNKERYNFDEDHSDCNHIANGDCDCYDRFVDWALEDAYNNHECNWS
ncbi:hypothetical protein LCGC14_1493260 [marine sediment metagenome]|uniref:Uncharacterized protein n=1 Tax=marine sediment metagenome TaxID=412755 RepID=A0A0F9LLN0_9ZZZZ